MKTTLILLFSVMALIVACTSTNPPTLTEVSVLRDVTSNSPAQIKAPDILRLYGLDKDKWNGGVFRYSDISQVSLNRSREAKIDKAGQWLSNEFQRKNEIKRFEKEVDSILSESVVPIGRDNSSIYLPIAGELVRLSQSKAGRRILLVYSDLAENTESISFYRSKDLKLLKTNPEALKERFEKLLPLPSLSGIEIYFIYEPTDMKSDEMFRLISELYRKMLLEDKGAVVNISANF